MNEKEAPKPSTKYQDKPMAHKDHMDLATHITKDARHQLVCLCLTSIRYEYVDMPLSGKTEKREHSTPTHGGTAMTGTFSMLVDALLEAICLIPQLWKYLILTRFRPRCFLSTQELQEIQSALDAYTLPSPRGWAHALSLGSSEKAKNAFSPDRIYTGSELYNLRGLLSDTGLDNPEILEKIFRAVKRAERLGVWTA